MKIVKHIPNTITCLNLLSGAISIIYSFHGDFKTAFLFMLLASVFDFCDGGAARLLKAYSDIGKELDSLADVISFGLAPSLILFNYLRGIDSIPQWLCYTPLLIAAFSALRLAKFNLDSRQSSSFIGLPTPACAIFVGAMIAYSQVEGSVIAPLLNNCYTIPILSLILSLLLVSEIPMFSLKFHSFRWKENRETFLFFITIVVIVLIPGIVLSIHWSALLAAGFTLYILWNLIKKIA